VVCEPTQPSASAPGKLILCGEHAVVYGRPAIALPVSAIRARATALPGPPGGGLSFDAPDLGRSWRIADAPDDPISQLAAALLRQLGQPMPDLQIRIASDIPIASGMGSGAAIATAIVRLLAQVAQRDLSDAEVSELVYESEKRYHGTPSGVDNTVVAFEQPVWFQRRQPAALIEPITIAAPFTLLIADTGVRSATRLPVGAVRQRWEAQPTQYDALFDQIGALAADVRAALERGATAAIGPLLSRNHALLAEMGVSSPDLDRLVHAAHSAGALGAKLSGAGWGGVMIALVDQGAHERVAVALRQAGAVRVLTTRVG
jgi:mevalonate kinase